MAGPAVLRHVPRDPSGLTTAAAASMVWTLGLIGGPNALDILAEYAIDHRWNVQSQLVQLSSYFDPKEFAERVIDQNVW